MSIRRIKILVDVDGSETSSQALAAAVNLARESGARLQPLFAVELPLMSYDVPGYDPSHVRNALVEEGKHVLADTTALIAASGVKGPPRMVETDLTGDDIAQDLVVMGTRGRRGVQRLVLGSVAPRFLRIATCPVLPVSAHCPPSASVARDAGDAVNEPR